MVIFPKGSNGGGQILQMLFFLTNFASATAAVVVAVVFSANCAPEIIWALQKRAKPSSLVYEENLISKKRNC